LKTKAKEKEKSAIHLPECFQAVISDAANLEEKMVVWRSVIEMRRSDGGASTDLLLKALVESEGDLNRSIHLLNNKDFVRQNASDLPSKVRNIFLPVNPATLLPKSGSQSMREGKNRVGRVDLIRSLREQQKQARKEALINAVNAAVISSYFSKK
jgi:hypothetical protein